MEGTIPARTMSNDGHGREYTRRSGLLKPKMQPPRRFPAGEVGYITASIKTVGRQGGRHRHAVENPAAGAAARLPQGEADGVLRHLPRRRRQYPDLRDALEKLQLNDASLTFEPETSAALGFGFRCGFLGLLHMEIIQERLEREFDLDLVTTAPSVSIYKTDGTVDVIAQPLNYPDPTVSSSAEEPYVKASIITPRITWATSWPCARTRGASSRTCSIWTPTRWSCTIRCRCTRSSTTSSTR